MNMEFKDKHILIAYFSHPGSNWFEGEIRNIKEGNTAKMAKIIQKLTGGDLFEIKTKDNYHPESYSACIEQAKKERNAKYRPDLSGQIKTDKYDVIFLGSPNWWGTYPMPVFTFLEKSGLKGKTIIPFITSEGSGFGNALKDLKKECPDSLISEDGLALIGSKVDSSEEAISVWLANLKI
jgi:flavodoxin